MVSHNPCGSSVSSDTLSFTTGAAGTTNIFGCTDSSDINFFSGATLILRRKFSVESFWEDCVKYKVTTVTYIGEMLRYLATAKQSPYETQHQIRGMFGNGLRPDVWKVFEERFKISNIIEFYGSSEGNISTCNVDSKFGAIGRIPPYLARKLNTKIVKFDVENEQIIRNNHGFCIECEADEAGEAIGQIPDENTFTGRFEGYTDEKASNKKILRDVFEKGDRWFTSGDLLKKDKENIINELSKLVKVADGDQNILKDTIKKLETNIKL